MIDTQTADNTKSAWLELSLYYATYNGYESRQEIKSHVKFVVRRMYILYQQE